MKRVPVLYSLGLAALVTAAGCFDADSTICPTGITCPPGTMCAASQAVCITDACGDGALDTADGEQCDDGNKVSGDGCSAACKLEGCGNGIVDVALGERCDDGNENDGDGCSADCRTNERCGNGIVDSELGEVCDDGNNISGDGCSADCLSTEECGNGYIDLALNEECEPTLPLSSSLSGIICGQNCRFASSLSAGGSSGGEAPPPVVTTKQCRLAINVSVALLVPDGSGATQPGTLPGRIVSNRGSLSCTPSNGVTCVSDPMDCGGKVTLALLPESTDAETVEDLAAHFDWGVEGCARAESMTQNSQADQTHPLWCDVPLSDESTELTISVSYDEARNQPEPPPPPEPTCTVNVSYRMPPNSDEMIPLPGKIISDKGGIDCGINGGNCSAYGLNCSDKLTLRFVIDDLSEDAIFSMQGSFFWNVPGCYPAMQASADGERHEAPVFVCEVGLSKDQRVTNVAVDYDYTPSPFRALCATAVSQNCGYESVDACVTELSAKMQTEQTSEENCADYVRYAMDCIRWSGSASDMCFSGSLLDKLSEPGLAESCAYEMNEARKCIVAKPELDTADLTTLFKIFDRWTAKALFGRTEVTVDQFQKCLDAGVCKEANVVRYKTKGDSRISNADAELCNLGRGDAFLNHPVNCVDNKGASDFCDWMGMHLPDSGEWETAATNIQKDENSSEVSVQDWPWGSADPGHCVEASYQSYLESASGTITAAFCNGLKEVTNNMEGTSPVGTFQAGLSFYGMADLSGNVWEWTNTPSDNGTSYVARGGGWKTLISDLLPAKAVTTYASTAIANDLGFRCAAIALLPY